MSHSGGSDDSKDAHSPTHDRGEPRIDIQPAPAAPSHHPLTFIEPSRDVQPAPDPPDTEIVEDDG